MVGRDVGATGLCRPDCRTIGPMKAQRQTDKSPIAVREYAPYVEADWGFKNHWYPAFFSNEIPVTEVKAVTIAGHDIVVRRVRGKLYALRDKCLHRGARFSQ